MKWVRDCSFLCISIILGCITFCRWCVWLFLLDSEQLKVRCEAFFLHLEPDIMVNVWNRVGSHYFFVEWNCKWKNEQKWRIVCMWVTVCVCVCGEWDWYNLYIYVTFISKSLKRVLSSSSDPAGFEKPPSQGPVSTFLCFFPVQGNAGTGTQKRLTHDILPPFDSWLH